jgi:sarcosine oxidase subunit beta
VRHDAVAWGFARAADRRGVDLLQNCEVTGIRTEAGRVTGVETGAGFIRASKVGLAVAATPRGSRVWRVAVADREPRAAGLRVRGLKPLIDTS